MCLGPDNSTVILCSADIAGHGDPLIVQKAKQRKTSKKKNSVMLAFSIVNPLLLVPLFLAFFVQSTPVQSSIPFTSL